MFVAVTFFSAEMEIAMGGATREAESVENHGQGNGICTSTKPDNHGRTTPYQTVTCNEFLYFTFEREGFIGLIHADNSGKTAEDRS